ncbi:Rrf2 family transcriptional regulator [Catellatospora sp. TT07R-123]|uniref:RrF2 family transcriptional regulator n=1 Tax=Catellatospora sp. TT07R-123 TaxID=2733863 RepID=UPI001B2832FD|nr:Rrf2 family transcriptional regulator [Catellatospora sp. TT07R-123]GHJ50275.1 Rrf2 family transcriptional regulator [Catellatospora sp. TT07R-123]
MQISARGDYAVRATLELANAYPNTISAQALADAQGLPRKFLEAVLADLRRSGVIHAVRGADGGYCLSMAPSEITIGMVLRAVDGPLAGVRGHRPEQTSYTGTALHLPLVWVAVRSAVRSVVDEVTLAQAVSGQLPDAVRDLTTVPDAWQPR